MTGVYVVRVDDAGNVHAADVTAHADALPAVVGELLAESYNYGRGNAEDHENAADAIRAIMPEEGDDDDDTDD
jgi:hypothetical protein